MPAAFAFRPRMLKIRAASRAAVVQNPNISKQPEALPLRRHTRLCFQLSDLSLKFLRLSSIGVKLAGLSFALKPP